MANSAIIKRSARSIHRAKPRHVFSDERASITKAINIKLSGTSNDIAPMQHTTPQQYITRAGRQCKPQRWTRDKKFS